MSKIKASHRLLPWHRICVWLITALITAISPVQFAIASGTVQEKRPIRRATGSVGKSKSSPTNKRQSLAELTKPVKRKLTISANPSDLEIFNVRLFSQPLIPMEALSNAAENRDLGKALMMFKKRSNPEDISALTGFLETHPESRWSAALEVNIAQLRFETGYLTDALKYWSSAWESFKLQKDRQRKAVADQAISNLVLLEARLGLMESLEKHLSEIGNRTLTGTVAEKVKAGRNGLWSMKHHPEISFKCGPFALRTLTHLNSPSPSDYADYIKTIKKAKSTTKGTNLAQLEDWSQQVGLKLQMAKRSPGAKFIAPAVMHWRVGHFAAITAQDHDRYRVQDSTFAPASSLWLSQEALESETDGYFLVPQGPLPSGWQPVTRQEAETVWGKGFAIGSDDSKTDSEPHTPCEGGGGGMASASAFSMNATLSIVDYPLSYAPPIGPSITIATTYNYNEGNQPSTFTFTNLGPDWSLNWVSYLTVDLSQNITVRVRGGGYETYNYADSSYVPNLTSQAQIVDLGGGSYQRLLPDGSIENFTLSDGTNIYMTSVVDPQGNAATIAYDEDFRVTSITDAAGNAPTTFAYVSDTPLDDGFYKVASITDGFSRSVTFSYDQTTTFLTSITDAAGNISEFVYDTNSSFINMMTTPYGITTFYQYTPQGGDPEFPPTGLITTLPDGSRTVIENWIGEEKTTYFWDREATALYPNDPANHNYQHCTTTRWLWDVDTFLQAPVASWTRKPLEAPIVYTYPGEILQDFVGTSNKPTQIARQLAGIKYTATISGTVTEDDHLGITIVDALLPFAVKTFQYVVQPGDTLNSIAAAFATSINSDPTAQAFGVTATAAANTVIITALSTNYTVYLEASEGSPTETITFDLGPNPITSGFLGGEAFAGDVFTITVYDAGLPGGEEAINYTVQSTDTLVSIVQGLAISINTNVNLQAIGVRATCPVPPVPELYSIIELQSNSQNATTYVASASPCAHGDMDFAVVHYNGLVQEWNYERNDIGYITKAIDPLGRTLEYSYDANNIDLLQVQRITPEQNFVLGQWQYDDPYAPHKPTLFIDSSGQQTVYTYNGFGELATITDARGNTSTLNYDGSGYLTQIQGPLAGSQDISTFTFYPYGPVHTITNAEGYTRTFSYDNLNRLTNVAYPDGTSEQIIYDRLDATMRSDRLGRWTTYAYDSLDQLIFEIDPLGRKTEYSWCRCGSLGALTDPSNHTTRWRHDLDGRVIQKIYADESTVDYVYGLNDRLQSSTDALNQSTRFFYNQDDTLAQKVYFNAVNPTSQVILNYDSDFPRVTTVSNGWGTYSYSYNPYIGSTSDTAYFWIGGLPQIPNATDTIDITFTNSALYGGQYTMPTYTVDSGDAGQPAQVAEHLASAITADVTLSTAGISATALGTLVTVSAGSPVSVTTTASGSTTATVGGGGRLAQITNSVMPDSPITFSYDSLGRTTNQMINGGNNSTAWTYDEISRVTQEVNPLGTFAYDYVDNVPGYSKGSSRLEKITYPNSQTANFSWYGTTQDLRLKEITSLTGGANPLGISRFTYAYNPAGEITKWLQQQQQHKVNYDLAYDEAGQLTGAGAGAATEAPPYVRQYQYNYDLAANRSSAQRESLQYARLGGTATIDDVLTVTATDPALGGGTQAVTYTVQSGDTLTTIAANLAAAVTASTAMQNAGISAVSDSTTVTLRSVSPNETTYVISLSGGATETVSTGLNRSLENITLGGSAQVGDVVTVRVRDASLGGGYQDVTYTVAGGNTLQDIATQLAAGFSGLGANFSATAVDKVITVESLSPNVTNYTSTVTGSTPTETVIISAVLDGAETFHIGGTKTTSDTISIIVNDIGLAGGSETVTYTVQGGDTLTTIASGIAAAINANSNLKALSIMATSTGTVVRVVSSSTNATSYLTAKSAGATETISVGIPSNGVVPATIAGTKTTSDVLTITVYDAGLTGGFKAIDYTVVGGDTINSIGTNLAAAITADSDLIAIGVSATAANPTSTVSVVNLHSTSLNATTYVSSVSGGATETLTLAPTVGVVQATHNDVNELTGLAAGGPVRFQGTTDRPVKPVTIASDPAAMLSSQSFTGSPTLTSGANSVSIAAESGGGTTTTNAYKVRVASTSPSTLTYDANGNMTDDGTNSFEWDAENRLIKIIYPGANNRSEFTYDALGRRVKIVETTAGSVTSTKQFIYNGNEICEERDAYNAVTKQFLALGWTDGTNSHFYGLNHIGSKTEVTDASSNIEEQYGYSPFGVQTLLQGSATSDFGYAGMYKHQRSGLNLTRFRAYNPSLGRWLSRDPIGEVAGTNLYAYVMNNPVNLTDPLGLAYIQWNGGHPQIVFEDRVVGTRGPQVPNYGYSPSGGFVLQAEQLAEYNPPGPERYNDAIMRQALDNVLATNQWLPANFSENAFNQLLELVSGSGPNTYALAGHNSRDFANTVLDEYRRLGGKCQNAPLP